MAQRKRAEVPPPAKRPTFEIVDCEQGGPDWFEARLGLPTASNFAAIMAQSDERVGRRNLLYDLAGEIMTGQPAEKFANAAMERGKVMEGDLRDRYARETFAEIRRVGFIRSGQKGCSPDALVGNDGGLEIKSTTPRLLIELLMRGSSLPPGTHKAQIQGNLWIAEREWWDLVIGYTGMPSFKVRVSRDEPYIRQLSDAIDVFNYDLKKMVEQLRSMG